MQVLSLGLRVVLVFGLLALVLVLLKKTDGRKVGRRGGALQVVGSTRVGKGAALTVVRFGGAEYVLGVTDAAVTLLSRQEGEPADATVTAPVTGDAPAPRTSPPSLPDFAAELFRSARRARASAGSTDVSGAAVSAALAAVRGTPAADLLGTPAVVADGPATPTSRHALRRALSRTDALHEQEQPWTRPARTPSRTVGPDVQPA